VAPAMTLTDRELQRLRDMAKTVMSVVGVETGGSNVQFAVNPKDGTPVVIEMNPRVSRSSALASKATGFPIAKIAALLAVGYTLDEIPNDITRVTPASFEPSLDYCVVKIPRWDFEKFPGADLSLGPQMKSVGEVMAIGRTFPEALNKAVRGLEIGASGFGSRLKKPGTESSAALRRPDGAGTAVTPTAVRARRLELEIVPSYYRVDTCAAEFEAFTPYLYSTYESGDEAAPTSKRKALIIGGGPNRIGQGIEFDYCCVQACMMLREMGFETIMVNCNPETVSTDYDTADRLYFEPLTLEDVLNVIEAERPEGVIVQFGGQTAINLARGLAQAGAPIWGTPVDSIDLAEDR